MMRCCYYCCCCCCCCCCSSLKDKLRDAIQRFLRDYDRLQYFAVILLYIQIGCALIGSLGALYNGVLLINLGIALFALVAIESSSQSLGRAYAVLLFCSILLDVCWFFLFFYEIWRLSVGDYGLYFIISVKLTLLMQIIGFSVRLSSSMLWIQIYRLGVSNVDANDFDLRNSFLSPATPAAAAAATVGRDQSDDALGGSIYDPAYYSTLFEDGQDNKTMSYASRNDGIGDHGSCSGETSQLKASLGRSFQLIDEEKALGKSQSV